MHDKDINEAVRALIVHTKAFNDKWVKLGMVASPMVQKRLIEEEYKEMLAARYFGDFLEEAADFIVVCAGMMIAQRRRNMLPRRFPHYKNPYHLIREQNVMVKSPLAYKRMFEDFELITILGIINHIWHTKFSNGEYRPLPLGEFAEQIYRVIRKNDVKSLDTHIIYNGKVTRRSKLTSEQIAEVE